MKPDNREGAIRYRNRPTPDTPRPNEVCLPEPTMRELLLAAKEAAIVLSELGALANVRHADNPKVKRLAAAIHFAEKACRKRANEMER